ncbi:Fe2+ or Zn2+ uptake regulation protein [Pseudomonas nitroreducens]|nr:Fe2+ or Zn2+ uptake regulation protein [Pseudomonas nitroreducens]MCP1689426.1 Fe2+ or Zn2+ uptake regulation protein [Pseudomonas nitroreducens]
MAPGHSGLQLVYHVLRYNVALLDVDLVDPRERATGECGESQPESETGQHELGVLHQGVTSTILAERRNPDHTCIERCCEAFRAEKAHMVENSELRKAGLKVTLPRVKILQMLDSAEQRHMSAEDVYKALMEAGEDVGLATVYRVLTQFEAAGLVVRHNFDGGHAVFELADSGHHDHMVCVDTGEVIEFMDSEIEKRQKEIVKERGFELVDHNLVLYVRKKK